MRSASYQTSAAVPTFETVDEELERLRSEIEDEEERRDRKWALIYRLRDAQTRMAVVEEIGGHNIRLAMLKSRVRELTTPKQP